MGTNAIRVFDKTTRIDKSSVGTEPIYAANKRRKCRKTERWKKRRKEGRKEKVFFRLDKTTRVDKSSVGTESIYPAKKIESYRFCVVKKHVLSFIIIQNLFFFGVTIESDFANIIIIFFSIYP